MKFEGSVGSVDSMGSVGSVGSVGFCGVLWSSGVPWVLQVDLEKKVERCKGKSRNFFSRTRVKKTEDSLFTMATI